MKFESVLLISIFMIAIESSFMKRYSTKIYSTLEENLSGNHDIPMSNNNAFFENVRSWCYRLFVYRAGFINSSFENATAAVGGGNPTSQSNAAAIGWLSAVAAPTAGTLDEDGTTKDRWIFL